MQEQVRKAKLPTRPHEPMRIGGPRNIRVNVVAPGLTTTPIIEASIQRRPDPEAYRRQRESQMPLQRLAAPEEVADAILFLASSESSYITGAAGPARRRRVHGLLGIRLSVSWW